MACVTTSTVDVCEEGTAKVSFILQDESDDVVIPTSLSWQLSDNIGTVIGSLTFANNDISGTQEIITIGSVTGYGFVVKLTGDDLAMQNSYDDGKRIFAVQGLYNSDLGDGNKLKGELSFTITNLINF